MIISLLQEGHAQEIVLFPKEDTLHLEILGKKAFVDLFQETEKMKGIGKKMFVDLVQEIEKTKGVVDPGREIVMMVDLKIERIARIVPDPGIAKKTENARGLETIENAPVQEITNVVIKIQDQDHVIGIVAKIVIDIGTIINDERASKSNH